jgi:hypothetical protein
MTDLIALAARIAVTNSADLAAVRAAVPVVRAAVAAARAEADSLVKTDLFYMGEGSQEHLGALDFGDMVEGHVATVRGHLVKLAADVGRIADGACEHRDQVNSFGGGHPDEVVAEAWAVADAWVAAHRMVVDLSNEI